MKNETTMHVLRGAAAHALDYLNSIPDRRHGPEATYAAMRSAFSAATPEDPASDDDAVIDALVQLADPGLNLTGGPRFFGWVIGGSHPVGIAADWLTSAWHQNCGSHHAAPAAAAAEEVAGRWLLDILDLPRECSVGFVTGATVANFVCLAAARSALLHREGWDVEAKGLFGAPPISVVIGAEAHTSVFAALQFLGLGAKRVIRVATDEEGRIDVASFERAAEACARPVIAIAQAGQVNSGAIDRFAQLVPIVRRIGGWLHVDGAFGLWARTSPAYAPLAAGIDGADSWATDGHKWLQTPYDCGYAIVRDSEAHMRAMTIAASYLPSQSADERDPSRLVPELSRRARGFATWAMIRRLGRRGIAEMIATHCRVARQMAQALAAEPGISVVNEVTLNQVIVRFGADASPEQSDHLTRATIERIQADGVCYAGGAEWRGRWVMRLSVISWRTDEAEGSRAAAAIIDAWRAVRDA